MRSRAWVVLRIDVVDTYRRHAVDLDDSLSGSCGVVVHAWFQVGEAACPEAHHLACIELIAHTDLESTRQHRNVLPIGMSVRCDFVAIRHFEANGEIAGCGHGVTFQHSQLAPSRQKTWDRTELHFVGPESDLSYIVMRDTHLYIL